MLPIAMQTEFSEEFIDEMIEDYSGVNGSYYKRKAKIKMKKNELLKSIVMDAIYELEQDARNEEGGDDVQRIMSRDFYRHLN